MASQRSCGLLDLFWNQGLLAETQRSLVEKNRLPTDATARWVDYLRQSFSADCIDVDQAESCPISRA